MASAWEVRTLSVLAPGGYRVWTGFGVFLHYSEYFWLGVYCYCSCARRAEQKRQCFLSSYNKKTTGRLLNAREATEATLSGRFPRLEQKRGCQSKCLIHLAFASPAFPDLACWLTFPKGPRT